jgi:hypothetical protein
VARYIGNKWGGKYLRAPDIYWTILDKGKGKLVRLGDIAEVRRGFTTGANEFFYLDEERVQEWRIEEEFLRPVVKSPRECNRIILQKNILSNRVFICSEDKKNLHGTNALQFIKWGESCKFHLRPTCATRQRWYQLKPDIWPNLVWIKSVNERHLQARIPFKALVDQRLYELSYSSPTLLNVVLNSSVSLFFKELVGRVNLGEGALDTAVYEANQMLIIDPALLPEKHTIEAEVSLARRDISPIETEVLSGEHQVVDNLIFESLSLTKGERDAVYETLINLVKTRLKKAQSLKPSEQRKRLEAASKTRGIWAGLPDEVDEEPEE